MRNYVHVFDCPQNVQPLSRLGFSGTSGWPFHRSIVPRSPGAEEPETGHATCPGGGQPPGWFPHFLRLALEVTPDRFLLREWEVPGSDPTVSERMEPLPTALHKGCAQPRLIGCGECRVTEGRMDLLICCRGVSRSG